MMMKADHPIFRDDFNRNRLFFRLAHEMELNIQSYSRIKGNLYKLHTDKGIYMLKGYNETESLDSIIKFSQLLHKSGFRQGVMYERFKADMYVLFEQGCYWVLTHFIPSNRRFTFLKEEDRIAGLLSLKEFHHYSRKLIGELHQDIPRETTVQKWGKRLELFEQHAPFLKKWFNPDVISEIVYYSHLTHEKLLHTDCLDSESVVLHGDVASHNFIRSTDNKVYLIDYDLLAIGNAEWDYVQYASRILPFIKWNRNQFKRHAFLEDHCNDHPWFLTALSFPMDILREGNRFSETIGEQDVPSCYANLSFFISTWNLRKQFLTNYNNLIQ